MHIKFEPRLSLSLIKSTSTLKASLYQSFQLNGSPGPTAQLSLGLIECKSDFLGQALEPQPRLVPALNKPSKPVLLVELLRIIWFKPSAD